MINQNNSIKLGKKGINFVTNVVDDSNSNFNLIQQENDIGIDGIIEFFDANNFPTGQMVCVQVKTGKSYYNLDKKTCSIPVDNHKEYWESLILPVIGIVCTINNQSQVTEAYWVNIKNYLHDDMSSKKITFRMSDENKFNIVNFKYGFQQVLYPKFESFNTSYDEAVELISNRIFRYYGYFVLAVKYSNFVDSWKIIFNAYETNDKQLNLSFFYNSISYLFPHPDHWNSSENYNFSKETKCFIQEKINKFTEDDIIKMLLLIGDEGIERGTIGQSIEILINEIDESEKKLLNIISDKTNETDVKESAEIILAYHNVAFYKSKINEILTAKTGITNMIIEQIAENDEIILY